jgi:hypothetical protein
VAGLERHAHALGAITRLKLRQQPAAEPGPA